MVTVPLLPQEDLTREREVIVEELYMYEDMPNSKAAEMIAYQNAWRLMSGEDWA
mgnify:CR=1 FL=1